MLLAIDPGADQGWAVFHSTTRQLVACGLGDPPEAGVSRVCLERPHPFKTKAPVRSIITLALRAGETAGPYRRLGLQIDYFEPAQWKKGSIKKDIHHARIWASLTPAEQEVISRAVVKVAKGKHHNVMDAVGIGMFAVGR